MRKRYISLINGPNLNKLGTRQPQIYGTTTLDQVEERLKEICDAHSRTFKAFQSNHEGAIIDHIQTLDPKNCDGIVLNPGALMMTGYGLYDALASFDAPVIEVHISHIYQRESFRHKSILSAICQGQITGLGTKGYELALDYLLTRNDEN